jgi:hypothetical protein
VSPHPPPSPSWQKSHLLAPYRCVKFEREKNLYFFFVEEIVFFTLLYCFLCSKIISKKKIYCCTILGFGAGGVWGHSRRDETTFQTAGIGKLSQLIKMTNINSFL